MAAYGALTSLLLSLDNIRDHNLFVSLHSHQLESLREKVSFLLRTCSGSNHESLETRIRDVAFRAEDLVAAAMDPDKIPGLLSWISYSDTCLLLIGLFSVISTAIGSRDVISVLTVLFLFVVQNNFPELRLYLPYLLSALVISVTIIWFPILRWGVIPIHISLFTLVVSLQVAFFWIPILIWVVTSMFNVTWFPIFRWGVIPIPIPRFTLFVYFGILKLIGGVTYRLNVLLLRVGFYLLWGMISVAIVMLISVGILWFLQSRSVFLMKKMVVGYILRNWVLDQMLDQIFKEIQLIAEATEGGAEDVQLPFTTVSSSSRYSPIRFISVGILWFLQSRPVFLMKKMVGYILRNWVLDQIFKEIQLIVEATEGGGEDVQLPFTTVSSSSRYSCISDIVKKTVVGMDRDLEMINTRFAQGSSKLQVVPVVGMGGIGKTTLATMVYNDNIHYQFDVRAWATVSENYSFRSVVLDLLNSAKLPKMEGEHNDDRLLGDHLYKCLYGRRYLMVLDDVWDVKVWDAVRRYLPSNGSRVLLTTRSSKVAQFVNDNEHRMQFLHEHESQRLLHIQVFGEKECPEDLRGIQEEIAHSCKGLPLALCVIGGLLSKIDKTQDSWRSFADGIKLASNEDNDEYERMELLALSYKHLPLHLRPCFLYMGVFPEDYEVSVTKLIQLWAAEGFLRSGASKSPEELAKEYLNELIERNLILVHSRSSLNGIKSCKMHDVLRKLCVREAQKEKFLVVLDDQSGAIGMNLKFYRRLSIHSSRRRQDFKNLKIRPSIAWEANLYSLLMYGPDRNSFKECGGFHYKVLRVLDLPTFHFDDFPPIYGLICLRYLALGFSGRLHVNISRLQNLQTIFLRDFFFPNRILSKDEILPVEIWIIPNLQHLRVQGSQLPPPPSGCNTSLQTLMDVKDLIFDIQILDKIRDIKKLSVAYGVENSSFEGWFKYKFENIACLNHLEKLRLEVVSSSSCLPPSVQGLAFPPSLKKLTLQGCRIPWKNLMTIVGALSNLEVLKLRREACVGEEWEPMVQFGALKLLELIGLDVVHWKADETHFPCLQCLIVRDCHQLQKIPIDFGYIDSLERIELLNCSEAIKESANSIREHKRGFGFDLKVSVQ